jgi:hypothetical protein
LLSFLSIFKKKARQISFISIVFLLKNHPDSCVPFRQGSLLKLRCIFFYESNEEENLLLDQAKLLTQILSEKDPLLPQRTLFFLQVFSSAAKGGERKEMSFYCSNYANLLEQLTKNRRKKSCKNYCQWKSVL